MDDPAALLYAIIDEAELQIDPDLTVGAMKRQAGKFFPDRDEIRVSRYLIERHPEKVEDVLRHELGHALAHHRHGGDIDPHGEEWREAMADLGVEEPQRTHALTLAEPTYVLHCQNEGCDGRIRRYRRSKVIENPGQYRCGDCGGRLERVR